jgi:hypothetical protein
MSVFAYKGREAGFCWRVERGGVCLGYIPTMINPNFPLIDTPGKALALARKVYA